MSEVVVVPLVAITNIKARTHIANLVYLPSIKESKEELKLINYEDFLKFVNQVVEKATPEHAWAEKIAEDIAKWVDEKYKPKGFYLLLENYAGPVQVAIVRGEFVKDWDVKMEALEIIKRNSKR